MQAICEFLTINPKTKVIYVISEWEVNELPGEPAREGKEKARLLDMWMKKKFPGRDKITIFGDTNMFQKLGEYGKDMPVSADFFKQRGINIVKVSKKSGDNTNFRHWINEYVKELLNWKKDDKGLFITRPQVYIFDTCKTLIKTIQELVTDEKDERDFDSFQDNDHAFDAFKYAANHFYSRTRRNVKTEKERSRLWAHAKRVIT